MAAAAAALARAKEPELARHWLVKCESLPEDQQRGETKTWRKALEANEPWSFDW
jgi:hypothetical protein